jgi:hypothetical protein
MAVTFVLSRQGDLILNSLLNIPARNPFLEPHSADFTLGNPMSAETEQVVEICRGCTIIEPERLGEISFVSKLYSL